MLVGLDGPASAVADDVLLTPLAVAATAGAWPLLASPAAAVPVAAAGAGAVAAADASAALSLAVAGPDTGPDTWPDTWVETGGMVTGGNQGPGLCAQRRICVVATRMHTHHNHAVRLCQAAKPMGTRHPA